MPEQVTAYMDSRGRLYASPQEANAAELKIRQSASAQYLSNMADKVLAGLGDNPLTKAQIRALFISNVEKNYQKWIDSFNHYKSLIEDGI